MRKLYLINPIIYFNVLILILSIYILFQWGNLLGFPIFLCPFSSESKNFVKES